MGLSSPMARSMLSSFSGVHRCCASQTGWAGLRGPQKKRAKTIIEVRIRTSTADSTRRMMKPTMAEL